MTRESLVIVPQRRVCFLGLIVQEFQTRKAALMSGSGDFLPPLVALAMLPVVKKAALNGSMSVVGR